jgi:hypothetical protein
MGFSCEFKKEFLFVTTMGDMPDAAWDVMPIGSCHGFPSQKDFMSLQLKSSILTSKIEL